MSCAFNRFFRILEIADARLSTELMIDGVTSIAARSIHMPEKIGGKPI